MLGKLELPEKGLPGKDARDKKLTYQRTELFLTAVEAWAAGKVLQVCPWPVHQPTVATTQGVCTNQVPSINRGSSDCSSSRMS